MQYNIKLDKKKKNYLLQLMIPNVNHVGFTAFLTVKSFDDSIAEERK